MESDSHGLSVPEVIHVLHTYGMPCVVNQSMIVLGNATIFAPVQFMLLYTASSIEIPTVSQENPLEMGCLKGTVTRSAHVYPAGISGRTGTIIRYDWQMSRHQNQPGCSPSETVHQLRRTKIGRWMVV